MARIVIDQNYLDRVVMKPGMATTVKVVAVVNDDHTYSVFTGPENWNESQIIQHGRITSFYASIRYLFPALKRQGLNFKEAKR